MRFAALGIFVATTVCFSVFETLPQILPSDEAKEDAGLRRTRDAALVAVKTRSLDSLMTLVSDDLVMNEGSDLPSNPKRALRDSLSDPRNEWWGALEDSLSLGGAFTTDRGALEGRREFCAPYFYAKYPAEIPEGVRGEGTPWVIIEKDVPLYARPDTRSRVVGKVSYALLQAVGLGRPDPVNPKVLWHAVEFPRDAESYVMASKIRNPEGFHSCFAKEHDGYRISLISRYRGL
jgi:hypothetical protein